MNAGDDGAANAPPPPASESAPEPATDTDVPSVAKPFRLQFEKAQDAWVLLYPEGMVKLNTSAGETLSRCDGTRDVAQIIALLEQAFERQGLGDDVRGFLGLARARSWVTLA